MTRKFRVIGIALAALFAFSAFASVAQAGEFEVEAGAGGTITVKGEQKTKHVFTFTFGKFECTTANYTGSLTNKSATLLLTPEYKTCGTGGIGGVIFVVNKCKFDFHAGETVGGSPDNVTITADIVECPTGAPITITTSTGCVVKISNQNGLSGITAKNETGLSPMDVLATINIKGIAYTESGGTAGCGNGTIDGEHSGATGASLTGTTTFKDSAGVKGFTVT